ncbi:Sphingosine N-acyltransferase lag1 [Coemansia asiatica]|uniref:Sphingosine N-acyltransferase lag1 n=1 Tax=Coemansia asiatica TaxID=1052880 RepID=A0A9W7XRK8_9FUNG|nr:Sphingosine N-acyltransferase lag1 [Coemansia asiatica]
MPPLEKSQTLAVAAVGPEHVSSDKFLLQQKQQKQQQQKQQQLVASVSKSRLRRRRAAKPSAELAENVGVDGRPIQRLSDKKNLVLNTRNPCIIFMAKNELSLCLAFMAIVHGCYWAGYEWPELWIRMQHKTNVADNGNSVDGDRYVRGVHDFKFVFYWIVQLIATRSILLHHLLPGVPKLLGIKSDRKSRRFCEMTWGMLYITASWCIGTKIWAASPYYMNTQNLYANYPDDHIVMPYGLKWYYLVQTAFWLSNVYTIHVEERRKDHFEMMAHHVTTITLVLLSYTFHFTRFGHTFMLVMDFPDIFLYTAKMLRYLNFDMLPNVFFGVFSVSWVITKHYLCLKMMISIWTQGTSLVPYEKRFPDYPNSYASVPIVAALWAFLLVLQIILIYWFTHILKVLHRVLIKGEEAQDTRSDDEDEEAAEEEKGGSEESEGSDDTAVSVGSSSSTLSPSPIDNADK